MCLNVGMNVENVIEGGTPGSLPLISSGSVYVWVRDEEGMENLWQGARVVKWGVDF